MKVLALLRNEVFFLFVCLGLGMLAEASFFHGRIGLSYPVFISCFYLVLFLRFGFSFHHRRIGLLIMSAVWVLAGSYLFLDSELLYMLNLVVLPSLVFFHIVLITSPKHIEWVLPEFLTLLSGKFMDGVKYSRAFLGNAVGGMIKNRKKQTAHTLRQVATGVGIGLPLLVVVIILLMSADSVFEQIVWRLPDYMLSSNFPNAILRMAVTFILSLLFFGIFQVLRQKPKPRLKQTFIENRRPAEPWSGVTALTVLVMLNTVYVLFAAVQFSYFFSSTLQGGLSYAQYARQGFFELMVVTLINWAVLVSCLKRVEPANGAVKHMMKIMYSALVLVSGIMIFSAYQRLGLYEAAYGYTTARLLAKSSMLFLVVVFGYTLFRIWIDRLRLTHFYLIAVLLFYMMLHVINPNQLIVENNLERWERTGKIDIEYMDTLGHTGVLGLVQLYEKVPDYPGLEHLLRVRKHQILSVAGETWQSYSLPEKRALERIRELRIEGDAGTKFNEGEGS